MIVWRVSTEYRYPWECHFEYPNPVPEPVCECFDDEHEICPCCRECHCERRNWEPTIRCREDSHVRVQLADGSYTECCSPEAHGLPVQWWAPVLNQPDFRQRTPSPFDHIRLETMDRLFKYVYGEQRIEEMAEIRRPFLDWFSAASDMRYGVIPIDVV